MTLSRRLLIAAALPALSVLLVLLTILFIPDRELEGVVIRGLASQGYTFKAGSFGKALPLGIRARDVHVGSDRGGVLRADRLSVRLRLFPLLAGKVTFACEARIGAGKLEGEVEPLGKGRLDLAISGLRLEDIPFFVTVTGARVGGQLMAEAHFRGRGDKADGELKLEVRGAEVGGVKIGDMPLPDASYRTVQGMLRAKAGRLNLESFTLEGDGLYVRLKGDLPLVGPPAAAPLNLALELMPQAEFLEKQKYVFLLLVKYQKSPGHYEIPIRGTLGKPAVF
jgi:type II secretion system protein N